MLERALQGGEPELIPPRAADELARTREGARLLVRVISSRDGPETREAAVYGFCLASITPPQYALMFRVFTDRQEPPGLRGQAAEVLGSHLSRYRPWRRRYWRVVEALVHGLDDPEPEVRYECIFALAKAGNDWLLPKLRHIAATDEAVVRGLSLRQETLEAIDWIEQSTPRGGG